MNTSPRRMARGVLRLIRTTRQTDDQAQTEKAIVMHAPTVVGYLPSTLLTYPLPAPQLHEHSPLHCQAHGHGLPCIPSPFDTLSSRQSIFSLSVCLSCLTYAWRDSTRRKPIVTARKNTSMSCMDPSNQFYILPDQCPTARKARSPSPLHIECLQELQRATAALVVSEAPPRSWKSSLAKPRADGETRCSKRVHFSERVGVRIIPARKLPALAALDLYDIMAASDEDFASFLGRGRQPDSPVPWRKPNKTSRRPRELSWSALSAAPRARYQMLSSSRSPQVTRSRTRSMLSALPCYPSDMRAPPVCNARPTHDNHPFTPGPTTLPAGMNRRHSERALSSVRSRQAFLRYLRQVRQRHHVQVHDTPLRRRHVRRCGLATGRPRSRADRPVRVTKQGSEARHASNHILSVCRMEIESPEPRPRSPPPQHQNQRYSNLIMRSNMASPEIHIQQAGVVSPRMKTYVDHIREQRGAPRPAYVPRVSAPREKVVCVASKK